MRYAELEALANRIANIFRTLGLQRGDHVASLVGNRPEALTITHSQWAPTMFQRLLALPAERRRAFNAPHHRVAVHGAAACPIPVKRAMINWWGPILVEYYSGSEGIGLTLLDRVRAHNQLRLGRLKQPDTINLDDSLPRTATGKVLRRELRNILNTTPRKSN